MPDQPISETGGERGRTIRHGISSALSAADAGLVLRAGGSVHRADHPDSASHPALCLYEAWRRAGSRAAAVVWLADRQLLQLPGHGPAGADREIGPNRRF